MARSVAIIGAGQIGYAAAQAFSKAGWQVRVLARSWPDWPLGEVTYEPYVAGSDRAPAADCVVDTIAFDAGDVARYDPDRVGRLIAVSSASVYCDANGRTLDEAAQNGFPEFDGPIVEEQSTVAPGPDTYSTRKVRMEQRALEQLGDRATILRPCAIYGAWSRHPREWWFVKRMLDGRERIPLLHPKASRFQPTDVVDIARFAVAAAESDISGVYNVADEDCPNVLEIGQAIAHHLGRSPEFLAVKANGKAGRTPWSVPQGFSVSGEKARSACGLGFSHYADGSCEAVNWLRDQNPADWRNTFPQLAAYPWELFDYEAEDAYFETL